MYGPREPLCQSVDEWEQGTFSRETVRHNGTDEEVTWFEDGSSIRHCGGPCGDMYYDENGEECCGPG